MEDMQDQIADAAVEIASRILNREIALRTITPCSRILNRSGKDGKKYCLSSFPFAQEEIERIKAGFEKLLGHPVTLKIEIKASLGLCACRRKSIRREY